MAAGKLCEIKVIVAAKKLLEDEDGEASPLRSGRYGSKQYLAVEREKRR